MFFVYAIYNSANNKIYIGQTANLEKRLKRHNGILKSRKKSYTNINRGGGEWKIVWQEVFDDREDAIQREKYLKNYRGRQFVKSLLN